MDRCALSAFNRAALHEHEPDNSQPLDRRDIAASLGGDRAAFGRIVERYEAAIARLMFRFSRDRQVHDELVQDVFVEAWRSLPRYRGDAPLLHWLRRIGTRVGYRFWRKRKRAPMQLALDAAIPDDVGERALEPGEAGAILDALLSRLEPADRLVLTLAYLEQYTVAQIAEQTGWSQGKVKMKSLRAKKKLRAIVEKEQLSEMLPWTT